MPGTRGLMCVAKPTVASPMFHISLPTKYNTVVKKHPDIFDCNLRMAWPILIIFGNICSEQIWLSNTVRISHLTLRVLTHYLGKLVTSKNHDLGVILGNICRYQITFKIIC